MEPEEDPTITAYKDRFARLLSELRGQDEETAEALVREWAAEQRLRPGDLEVALMARVMSHPHWLRRHPVAAVALAWRYRAERPPHRTLHWLARPRITG